MKNLILFIYLTTLLLTTNCSVIKTFSFFRHGARNEMKYNKFIEDELNIYGEAELTGMGFSMSIEKGKLFRERYEDMGLKVKPEDVSLISTPVQRTIYTAYTFFKGFFGDDTLSDAKFKSIGGGEDVFNIIDRNVEKLNPYRDMFLEDEGVKYLVINVISKENWMFYKMKCTNIDKNEKSVLDGGVKLLVNEHWVLTDEIEHLFPGIKEFYCNKHNLPVGCLLDETDTEHRRLFLIELAGFFEILEFYKIKDINENILNISNKLYIADRYNYSEKAILQQGTISSRILKDFFSTNCNKYRDLKASSYEQSIQAVLNNIKCKKQAFHFTHDDIITQVIRNIFDFKSTLIDLVNNDKSFQDNHDLLRLFWPPFLSEFTFEQHHINSQDYIKIYFNGKEMNFMPFYRYNGKELLYTNNGVELNDFIEYLKSRIDMNTEYNNNC
jgi:hypothetical protein